MDKESKVEEERNKMWRFLVKCPLGDEDIQSIYRIYGMMLDEKLENYEDRVIYVPRNH